MPNFIGKEISPMYCASDQKSAIAMLMGKEDNFITTEEAKKFYDLIPISDKKLKFHNSGHEFPPEFVKDAIKRIDKHNDNN